jgi:hypothetical protein
LKPVEREEYVPGNEELCVGPASSCISRERIITRHMRMDHFDLMLLYKLTQCSRTRNIKSITERQDPNLISGYPELANQWRPWPHCSVKIMPAVHKGVTQIYKVTLASAKG